jgi:hypothetical protein
MAPTSRLAKCRRSDPDDRVMTRHGLSARMTAQRRRWPTGRLAPIASARCHTSAKGRQIEVPDLDYGSQVRVSRCRLGRLGSGLIEDHSQKMTVAARATAERKAFGHLS